MAIAELLEVQSVFPPAHTLIAPVDTTIRIQFDRAVNTNAVVLGQSLMVFGRWSGAALGTITYSSNSTVAELNPVHPFSAGETVTVVLSHAIEAADGTPLRQGGYSFHFWTATRETDMDFQQVGQLDVRSSPTTPTQAYGGIATDLDGDRFLDISIVNEITGDLRVFLNRADRSGLFDDFLIPPSPVNDRASPSEPADFDRNGTADLCVANINTNSVSILLGNGNGTFAPQQEVAVGGAPRGIAVLDVDGDGDMDIVNTNSGGNNMSLLLNDGFGVFQPPIFFEGGGSAEWALAAADMNNDGIMDLVIGARNSQQILVRTGNGDGTFSPASSQASGGLVWMLVVGDVNGDGNQDVATANSFTNNGAILLGDGDGGLGPPQTYATDPFSIATDLGDLDGDGDLDWITSSFSGDWLLFTNAGDGSFTFNRSFDAPSASSCSLMFDSDNDGDLDLGLIDEIADVVLLMKNSGTADSPKRPIPALTVVGKLLAALSISVVGVFAVYRRLAYGSNVAG